MKFYYYKARPKMAFPAIAWLIMLFQGMNPFKKNSSSHRALGYKIMETDWVVDATGSHGVMDSTLGSFLLDYKIVGVYEFELDIDPGKFCQWVASQKGKKYDRLQIVGLILKTLGFVSFNKIGKNYKKLICNELILLFVSTFLKIPVGDSDNWDMIMVDDLITEIKAGKYVASVD